MSTERPDLSRRSLACEQMDSVRRHLDAGNDDVALAALEVVRRLLSGAEIVEAEPADDLPRRRSWPHGCPRDEEDDTPLMPRDDPMLPAAAEFCECGQQAVGRAGDMSYCARHIELALGRPWTTEGHP